MKTLLSNLRTRISSHLLYELRCHPGTASDKIRVKSAAMKEAFAKLEKAQEIIKSITTNPTLASFAEAKEWLRETP